MRVFGSTAYPMRPLLHLRGPFMARIWLIFALTIIGLQVIFVMNLLIHRSNFDVTETVIQENSGQNGVTTDQWAVENENLDLHSHDSTQPQKTLEDRNDGKKVAEDPQENGRDLSKDSVVQYGKLDKVERPPDAHQQEQAPANGNNELFDMLQNAVLESFNQVLPKPSGSQGAPAASGSKILSLLPLLPLLTTLTGKNQGVSALADIKWENFTPLFQRLENFMQYATKTFRETVIEMQTKYPTKSKKGSFVSAVAMKGLFRIFANEDQQEEFLEMGDEAVQLLEMLGLTDHLIDLMSGRLYEKISKSSGSNLAGLLSGNTGDLGALLAMAGPGLASVHTTTSKTSTDDENYDSGVDYEESSFVSNDHFESIMELYESMFRDGESVNQTSASSELNGRVFLQAWYISMQRYGREKGKLHSKPLTAAQFDLYMESIEVPYSNVLEFTYPIKNEKFCSATPDSEIVIMVVSKVKNLPQRNAIRKTWAAAAPPAVKVLFFLSDNTRYRTAIHQESKKYSDLVSVDVPQTYEYAARKSLAALDWPIRFCNKTRYIFETTDGVYVNASILVGQARFASEAEPAGKPVIIGRLVRNTSVPRIPLKLEYLFYDEYPFDVFPTYLKGFGLLMNMDFAKQAVAAGKDFPLLRTGDFLISGILAAKLKTTPHSFQKHGVASVRGEDIAEGHVSGLCEKKESVVFGERLTAPAMLMIDATLRTC